jgi:O-antigen ligase
VVQKIEKAIYFSFSLLFFLLPLIVIPVTSELFEFNKIVFLYILTTIITSFWLAKIIISQKLTFKKTPLDLPIITFLLANLISTYFSIDRHMSIFGYYSRFNGGLLSIVSYTLLYFAFVNNIKKEKVIDFIKITFASSVIVCLYAILQKAGIDKNIWVQDVQNRVFSTLGQPNWLSAFIVFIFPTSLGYAFYLGKKRLQRRFFILALIYFLVLLFTKSRSGLLGFVAANILFWLISSFINKAKIKKQALLFNLSIIFITLIIGTPWTPSLKELISKNKNATPPQAGTVLETGGTESGEIRKIVWKGALKVFKDYPVFGTGPETFALSYFKYKPAEHNLTSEWDFVYNKAHNEYLNYLANTGILGLLSYLILILSAVLMMAREIKKTKDEKEKFITLGLLSGYIGFLTTNIFGFSVAVTSFLFFIYPAIAFSFKNQAEEKEEKYYFDTKAKISLLILGFISIFITYKIINYWLADFYYSRAKDYNRSKNYPFAQNSLNRAIKLNPKEPVYLDELAKTTLGLAISAFNKNNQNQTEELANKALDQIKEAVNLSPNNIFFRKTYSSILIQLSIIDPKLTTDAENSLLDLSQFAPTDPKVYYNLGLIYLRSNNPQKAKEVLEKSVELKSNYRDGRLALSTAYNKLEEKEKAKEELKYILEKINPNDEFAKNQLEEIK